MKPINEMKLSFQSRSANEAFARTAVSAFISCLDPNMEEITDIKTAVSEAVTNSIVHAYKDQIDTIYINASIFKGGHVIIRIKDKGCGISNIKQAMEPLYTTCESGERAGLGFAVMQSLCDKIKVFSRLGYGTTVVLEKNIISKGL